MPKRAIMCIICSKAVGASPATCVACAYATSSMESPRVVWAERRSAPLAVAFVEPPRERCERPVFEGLAGGFHGCLVKRDVVQGQRSIRRDLSLEVQMTQVSAREER